MNPRLRNGIIIALGVAFATVAAVQIANEQYLWAMLATLATGWLCVAMADGARPEAWILAFALFGYIVGNRGFAQISVSGQFPLLFAEATLAVVLPALLARAALRQAVLFQRDALNYSILLWLAIGTARLPVDVRNFGVIAVRDYATLYYALFFFLAQSIAVHEASERLLRRTLQAAVLVLPVTFFLSNVAPSAMFKLQFRGVPVLFYKEDLVAAALFSGFFVLLARPAASRLALWRWCAAAVCYGSAFAIGSSRAGIAGLIVTLAWWALGRQRRPFKLQAVVIPAGLIALLLVALVRQQEFNQSRIYALYEHVASMVDVTGTRKYTSADQQFVGDNNRFRLAWWRSVAEETLDVNPVLGVGFGYDITTPFVRNYEFDLGEDFTTRSPHSIIMTVFGRLGLVGLVAWLAVIGSAMAGTWRLLQLGRRGDDISSALGWWSVSWVYVTSACFGVVLEGPMGAVVFWTSLGVASARTRALTAVASVAPAASDATNANEVTAVHEP